MLESLQAYGAERLAGEADRWRERHLHWCLDLADQAAARWHGPDQVPWVRRLRSELPNLRAALDHAVGDPALSPAALRILVALEPFWLLTERLAEAQGWLDRALAHPGGSRSQRARAGALGCWLGLLLQDRATAEVRLREAEECAGGADDADDAADAAAGAAVLRAAAAFAAWERRPGQESAEERLRRAARLSARAGDRWGGALALHLLGEVAHLEGRDADAVTAHEQCVEHGARVGEVILRSASLTALAEVALDGAELDRARWLACEALTLRAALGDGVSVAGLLALLGRIAMGQGDPHRGSLLLGAARARWEHPPGVDLSARRRGERLAVEEAVRYAVEGVLPVAEPVAEPTPLTPRELEVAELVGRGMSNRVAAEALGLSHRTVQGHVENILRKLGFTSRAQVAAWVAERRAGRREG
jgi:non-specific serine/threonine protein kinase